MISKENQKLDFKRRQTKNDRLLRSTEKNAQSRRFFSFDFFGKYYSIIFNFPTEIFENSEILMFCFDVVICYF
jgi:hypothetical protein